MEQWLASLPKTVVAIGAILIGTFLIILFDPPRTVCDTQFEVFKDAQKDFLFSSERNGIKRGPELERLVKLCKTNNSPGGCFELFQKYKKLAEDVSNIPQRCLSEAAQKREIRQGLVEGVDLLVQLAWGDSEPLSYTERSGWLDASDLALFCRMRDLSIKIYGEAWWASHRDQLMSRLPLKAANLPREQIWQRSILSSRCEHFR